MSTGIPYKRGIVVASAEPTGPAGQALNSNFKGIADQLEELDAGLAELSPQPAPSLAAISLNLGHQIDGFGKPLRVLSFGESAPVTGYANVAGIGTVDEWGCYSELEKVDAGQSFDGIADDLTGISGLLAVNVWKDVPQSPQQYVPDKGVVAGYYPENAFGDADKGLLHLEINGSVVRSVDLTALAGVNDPATGFSLSPAEKVRYAYTGDDYPRYYYRTGGWLAAPANFRKGWNYVRCRHEVAPGEFRDTHYVNFIYDADGVTYEAFPERTNNGTFDENLTGWTVTGSTATWDAGTAILSRNVALSQTIALSATDDYTLEFDVRAVGSSRGNITYPGNTQAGYSVVLAAGGAPLVSGSIIAAEHYRVGFTADAPVVITFHAEGTPGFVLDNVSVR